MHLYIAGTGLLKNHPKQLEQCKFILESYVYVQEWQLPFIKSAERFLLDSGAFTFMKKKKEADWDVYLRNYADFIVEHNIKHFFELDIDYVVGYERVKQLRNTLERFVGRQCIPVWHKQRGADEYRSMCKDYDYVAVGGIAGQDKNPIPEKYFASLIDIAHENGAMLHGLGYASSIGLSKYRFDSADSTTWNVGAKYGNFCQFRNGRMRQLTTPGKRCIDREGLMLHNYGEWLKFQKYADIYL